MPKRIKFDRRHRLPEGAKLVARRSRFANPYPVEDFGGDHAAAVRKYCEWLDDPNAQPVWCKTKWYPRPTREQIVAALRAGMIWRAGVGWTRRATPTCCWNWRTGRVISQVQDSSTHEARK